MHLGRGVAWRGRRPARVSVAEGAGLCALGEGCCGDGGGWRVHLLLRVRGCAPWAWARWVGAVVGVVFCSRGCRIAHPRLSNRCVVGVSMR